MTNSALQQLDQLPGRRRPRRSVELGNHRASRPRHSMPSQWPHLSETRSAIKRR